MKIGIKIKDKKISLYENKYKIKYYVLFIFMVILSLFTIKTNIKLNENLNEESYLVFKNNDLDNIYQDSSCNNKDTRFIDDVSIIDEKTIYNINNKKKNNNFKGNISVTKEDNDKNKNVLENKILEFVKPLNGKLIKDYSENLVYSKTLEMWKVHDGIDIGGNINDNIIATEDGIVERIFEDSFYGNTLILKHKDNYKSIYCNISPNFKLNDKVKKYDIIGKLDNSGIGEFKDEYHLHFMMKYNDKIIDPNIKIKF